MQAETLAPGSALTRPRHLEYGLLLGMLGIAAAALLLWLALPAYFLIPAPLLTFRLLYDGLVGQGWLWEHIRATFQAVGIGFVLALVVGIGAGILLGGSRYWRAVWEPILLSLYAIPKITLYPILLLFFGTNIESRIAMAFIHAVFPLLVNSMVGVSTVNPTHVKVARMAGASARQTVAKIYFPSMAPALVAGVRMGFSLAIIGVVLSELFAAKEGLGLQIMKSYAVLNIERMFAIIFLLFVVALVVNISLWGLEKRLRAHQV